MDTGNTKQWPWRMTVSNGNVQLIIILLMEKTEKEKNDTLRDNQRKKYKKRHGYKNIKFDEAMAMAHKSVK